MNAMKKAQGRSLDWGRGRGYPYWPMLRFLVCIGALVVLVGCSTTDEGFIVFRDPQEFDRVTMGLGVGEEGAEGGSTNQESVVEGATTESSAEKASAKSQIIGIGAKLSIYVEEDSSLDRQIIVGQDGVIDFPPLGRVAVDGLSTDELRQRIKKDLERDYFQTANVTVTMEKSSAGGGVIYILRSGNNGGPMAIPPGEDFTMTKVMLAAGSGPFSDLSRVEIIRYGTDGKKYKTRVNVARIMSHGQFEKDIPVRNGDWIIVPEKIFNF
jgi:protein involved in polysaccharide export with SLBB domain